MYASFSTKDMGTFLSPILEETVAIPLRAARAALAAVLFETLNIVEDAKRRVERTKMDHFGEAKANLSKQST